MKQWTPKSIPFVAPKVKMAWEPKFKQEGGTSYVKISPGLVNNFIPTNFNTWFSLPKSGKLYFNLEIKSDLNGSTFSLTSVSIVVETNPPPKLIATKNGPPADCKISLGVFDDGAYYMFYNQNINMFPNEVLKTDKEEGPQQLGGDPFDRWFTWVMF